MYELLYIFSTPEGAPGEVLVSYRFQQQQSISSFIQLVAKNIKFLNPDEDVFWGYLNPVKFYRLRPQNGHYDKVRYVIPIETVRR